MNEASLKDDLSRKEDLLREIFSKHAPLLIAYSGGVDSTLLLALAHKTLGDQVTGIIADSPSLPRASLAKAIRVAAMVGVAVEVVAVRVEIKKSVKFKATITKSIMF